MGQTLKALMMWDTEGLRLLPDDPSPEEPDAVLEAAFDYAVKTYLSPSIAENEMEFFLREVNAISWLRATSPATIIGVIEGESGMPRDSDDDPEEAVRVKAGVLVQVVEALGLVEREIDAIVLEAEQKAARRK